MTAGGDTIQEQIPDGFRVACRPVHQWDFSIMNRDPGEAARVPAGEAVSLPENRNRRRSLYRDSEYTGGLSDRRSLHARLRFTP